MWGRGETCLRDGRQLLAEMQPAAEQSPGSLEVSPGILAAWDWNKASKAVAVALKARSSPLCSPAKLGKAPERESGEGFERGRRTRLSAPEDGGQPTGASWELQAPACVASSAAPGLGMGEAGRGTSRTGQDGARRNSHITHAATRFGAGRGRERGRRRRGKKAGLAGGSKPPVLLAPNPGAALVQDGLAAGIVPGHLFCGMGKIIARLGCGEGLLPFLRPLY